MWWNRSCGSLQRRLFQAREQPVWRLWGNALAWTSPAASFTVPLQQLSTLIPQIPLRASPPPPTHTFPRFTNSSIQTLFLQIFAQFYKFLFSYSKIVIKALLPWWSPDLHSLMLQNSEVTKVQCDLRVHFIGSGIDLSFLAEVPAWHGSLVTKWNVPIQCCVMTMSLRSLGVFCAVLSALFSDGGVFVICTWSQWGLPWALVIDPMYLVRNLATWPGTYKKPWARLLGLFSVHISGSWFEREKHVWCDPTIGAQACLSSPLAGWHPLAMMSFLDFCN